MELIKVNKDNIKEVVELANTIWHEHYKDILSQEQIVYMLNIFLTYDAINKQLLENYKYYLINEDKYIGFISYIFENDYLYLSKIYVDKDYRNKGIGKKCIEFIEEEAKRNNKEYIELNVNRYNLDSIKAYESLGFKRVRIEDNDIGNNYYMEDYVYRKQILHN